MNTSLRTMLCAALLAAMSMAQDGAAALQRARLLERQEGDLRAAEQAYRAIVGDAKAAAAVQQEAALRLGELLWRLDRKDEAKPLLERAAAGGGACAAAAQALLQGKGEGDRQQQERRVRAHELVNQAWTWIQQGTAPGSENAAKLEALEKDLMWYGRDAAEALAAATNPGDLPRFDTWRGSMLWKIGTGPAQQFFAKVAASPDAQRRQAMVTAAGTVAADMLPVMLGFLRVADPLGAVHKHALDFAAQLPLDQLEAMLRDPLPPVRAAALRGIGGKWNKLPLAEQERLLTGLDDQLEAALDDADPFLQREAWTLLDVFAREGPRPARRVFLAHLGAWPREMPAPDTQKPFPLDDQEMELLLKAGEARPAPADVRQAWTEPVTRLFLQHQPEWGTTAGDAVLRMVELGHGIVPGQGTWADRLLAVASPPQLLRLLRDLPFLSQPDKILEELARRDLPAGSFAAARSVFERCLLDPPAGWRVFEDYGGRRNPAATLTWLLQILGNSADPQAAAWLDGLVERLPVAAVGIARALVALSIDGVGDEARAAMRRLLVWEPSQAPGLEAFARNLLFAELARVGDVQAVALFPRAYALGLESTLHPLAQARQQGRAGRPSKVNHDWYGAGIAFLGLVPQNVPGPWQPWHGYDDAHLLEAWRLLLDCDSRDRVILDLTPRMGSSPTAPPQVLPLLAAALPALRASVDDPQGRANFAQMLMQFRWVAPAAVAEETPLRAALQGLLQHEATALELLGILRQDTMRALDPLLRRGMAASDKPADWLFLLQRASLPIGTEEWLRALRLCGGDAQKLLQAVPPKPEPELMRAIEALLGHSVPYVRTAACEALARLLDPSSVAPLLQALRDEDESVRKAAADALEKIRFFQEQQAHWSQVQAGIETAPQAALAKLLGQGKPDQPRNQRLLAIRSLAVLNAPEALPYLIDWTKDADAGVADAARAAVAQIHREGTKAESGK